MNQVFEGIPGVLCRMSDILITGSDVWEHDKRLEEVLKRLSAVGITRNDKYEFSKTSVKLLGHVLGTEGIRPDPEKVRAIMDFPAPVCVTEARQFIGMANQVGRVLPNLSEKLKPIGYLLRKDTRMELEHPAARSIRLSEGRHYGSYNSDALQSRTAADSVSRRLVLRTRCSAIAKRWTRARASGSFCIQRTE